ncbi:MAG TPA: hypothetical protein VGX76_02415, partial [Pirellulales bacterium]|nr:hypothetical protein [Pirellulales bacterium]
MVNEIASWDQEARRKQGICFTDPGKRGGVDALRVRGRSTPSASPTPASGVGSVRPNLFEC